MAIRTRRMRRSLGVAAAMGALGVVIGAALSAGSGNVANAQTKPSATQIRYIDSTAGKDTEVAFSTTKDVSEAGYALATGGTKKFSSGPTSTASDVMVVLDTSKAAGNRVVQEFKEFTAAWVPGKDGIARLGVVTTGGKAAVPVELTSDPSVISVDLEPVAPSPAPGTFTYDGVILAAKRLSTENGLNDIIVFHTRGDDSSTLNVAAMRRAIRDTRSQLHVIDLEPSSPDGRALAQIVSERGGSYSATDEAGLSKAVAQVTSHLSNQYRASFPTPPNVTRQNLSLSFGGAEGARVSFQPGGLVDHASAMEPLVTAGPGLFDRLNAPILRWAIAGLAIMAAGGLAYAALNLAIKDKDSVRARLEAYSVGTTQSDIPDESALGTSELLKRAVARFPEFAERRGFAERIDLMLERADVSLHAGEVVFLTALAPLLLGLFSYVVFGSIAVAAIAILIGAALPVMVLRIMAARRMRAFESQLPDALQLLAGTLRAGFSITQAVTSVADDIEEPIGKELRRSVAEMQLGRNLEDSLDGVAQRLDSNDFRWAVLAIRIQREVGGNLAELLMTVADTMVQRQRLLRDVRSMTAEGRMSAFVLGALPIGMIGFLAVSNPSYLAPLTSGVGLIIAIGSGLLMLGGFFWMNKIIKIEV